MKHVIVLLLSVAGGCALAQAPAALPADAQTLVGEELKARFAGKTYDYRIPGNNTNFRMQYNDSGYAFVNGSNGLADSGAYRVEGSKICTDWKKIPGGCNEIRAKGDMLYAQRSDGSWATMTLR